MKTKLFLETDDIRSILAKQYGVSEQNVTIAIKSRDEGYARNYHREFSPYAVIELQAADD